mgnify:FL=1
MQKKIFVNQPLFDNTEINAIQKIIQNGLLSSSNINGGEFVQKFEKQIQKYLNVKHAVAVNSGTSALFASLLSLDIKTGDEVIIPSFSFSATASAVIATGAKPIFTDISSSDFNIDPLKIQKNISIKTKAIIPVHLYGYPANINEILEIASSNNIQIIEDGAQSLGSKYYGKMCGALGNIGCTSFYPTKVITSGEGGIITTNNDVVYDNLLKIRNHGFNKNNQTTRLGLNFRMPEIEAAIVSTQLNKLDNFIKIRQRNAKLLSNILENHIDVPNINSNTVPNWYLYTLSVHDNRSHIVNFLKTHGIQSGIYYETPIHVMPFYSKLVGNILLPNTTVAAKEVLSLPIHQGLDIVDIEFIADSFLQSLKN